MFLGILEYVSGVGGRGMEAFLACANISSISAYMFSDDPSSPERRFRLGLLLPCLKTEDKKTNSNYFYLKQKYTHVYKKTMDPTYFSIVQKCNNTKCIKFTQNKFKAIIQTFSLNLNLAFSEFLYFFNIFALD